MNRSKSKKIANKCFPDKEHKWPAQFFGVPGLLTITISNSNQVVLFSGKDLEKLKEAVLSVARKESPLERAAVEFLLNNSEDAYNQMVKHIEKGK